MKAEAPEEHHGASYSEANLWEHSIRGLFPETYLSGKGGGKEA